MHRELPPRANLDHLKKQAKDLLDAHQRKDPEALGRIRDAVPSFRGKSDEEIARAPFALHDAQSAIAREYGHKSWNELRAAVEAQAAAGGPMSEELLRALMPLPFPAEVGAVLRDFASRKRSGASALTANDAPFPESLPLLPMRDALFVPGAVGPIHVGRASTRAAVQAALAREPQTLAVFAQRRAEQEEVGAEDLHPVGCEVLIHAHIPDGADRAWLVVEGMRWIALESLATASPPGHLAVEIKARFAAEPKLVDRLRLVSTLVGARP